MDAESRRDRAHSDLVSIDRTAYPFRSYWLGLSTGRMHYVDEGSGEVLLFVHGTPTRHSRAGIELLRHRAGPHGVRSV